MLLTIAETLQLRRVVLRNMCHIVFRLDAHVTPRSHEGFRELRIAIEQRKSLAVEEGVLTIGHVPVDLRHPRSVGTGVKPAN